MDKTKLGITAKAYASLTFLAGLLGIVPVLIMAGAVLIMEENDWLKRMVVKSVVFVLLMAVLGAAVSCLSNGVDLIKGFLEILNLSITTTMLSQIIYVARDAVNIISDVGLALFAFQAYSGSYVKVPVADDIVEKNM